MLAALTAALVAASAASAPSAALDRQCYALMAELAADPDPAVRDAGIAAAQFFLGRIDAVDPGFDPAATAPVGASARRGLLDRCGAELQGKAGSFRAAGEALRSVRPDA